MCATHIAELLHYLRRGPQYFGDPGAAYVELSFLAENGFVEIDDAGRISWNEEDFCRGMTALASALTDVNRRRPRRARLRSVPRPLRLADRDGGNAHPGTRCARS